MYAFSLLFKGETLEFELAKNWFYSTNNILPQQYDIYGHSVVVFLFQCWYIDCQIELRRQRTNENGGNMRLTKAQQLITLAIAMQASRQGLSLNDIAMIINDRYGEQIVRRTAERLRDALSELFPKMYVTESNDTLKRWKLPYNTIDGSIEFTAEELASIDNAIHQLESMNISSNAYLLKNLRDKLQAKMKHEDSIRLSPDIEALTKAEGIAFSPKPYKSYDINIISNLRTAILATKKVRINYQRRGSETISSIKIEPYGFLYGSDNYLVGYWRYKSDYRHFALSGIKKVEILDDYYDQDEDFSFKDYTKDMFGSFREEPLKVKFEFCKDVAEKVKDFIFHPSQTIKEQEDGTVLVELYVSGSLELCWHLFKWGNTVKILSPAKLKKQYCQMIKDVAELY